METKNTKPQLFKPGEGGRPKGARNKTTREIKERVEWMLELADERIEESIAKLRPKELVDLAVSLQEYVRPKLQRMNLDMTSKDEKLRRLHLKLFHRQGTAKDKAPRPPKMGEYKKKWKKV